METRRGADGRVRTSGGAPKTATGKRRRSGKRAGAALAVRRKDSAHAGFGTGWECPEEQQFCSVLSCS
jgi:hypothetical protein